jgi:PAS domain S-box-containing protein
VLLLAATAVIALVAITGFALERSTAERVRESSSIMRQSTMAQRLLWDAESGARAYLLARDATGPARTESAKESLAVALGNLRVLFASSPDRLARLGEFERAFANWDSKFARPIFANGTLTLELALAGTIAFDEATAIIDGLVESESELRFQRLDRQVLVGWARIVVLLAALGIVAWMAQRFTRALQHEAILAEEQQHRIEEQAAELEQQASQLEEQTGLLEDHAEELKARVLERDETNRLLTQTATFLDSALESAPFGIAFYDRGLRFQRVNDTLVRINGLTAEEHLGRRLDEVIPGLAPTIRPIMDRVLATGVAETNVVIEGETPAFPGEHRRWLVTYYPILRPGSPPVGVGAMVVDVTDQHRLEQQLRQAQKLEAVGRLAGGIAHDFNNVLTVIQSYAEVLAFELEDSQQGREEIEAIRGAADRAAALARQLLAFSRRDVIIPRDLDVNEVIRGLDLMLRRLVKQGVELRIELAPHPLIVRLDAGQFEQVIMNLVINAVDAMPKGGALTLRTDASVGNGEQRGMARVTVEDQGTGMSADIQERLFEPFFTTKPAGKGTGLGLATAYAIVHEAGGEILVESNEGAGSRFDVTLPFSVTADVESARRLSPARGLAVARPGEIVLLVEDEPAIRTALGRVLTGNGYRVLDASNGGEALRVAESEPGEIHVLLTDVMMPGIGGKELVQRFLKKRPTTRVILMSGFTDDLDLREELGTAKFLFLQKPFAARRVLSAVREVLDGA